MSHLNPINEDAMEGEAFSSSDNGQRFVVKAEFNGDIRKFQVTNITYDNLVELVDNIFRVQLTPNERIAIKYEDGDGEWVTMADSTDLMLAINSKSGPLRLRVYRQLEDEGEGIAMVDIPGVHDELATLFNRVDGMLGGFENQVNVIDGTPRTSAQYGVPTPLQRDMTSASTNRKAQERNWGNLGKTLESSSGFLSNGNDTSSGRGLCLNSVNGAAVFTNSHCERILWTRALENKEPLPGLAQDVSVRQGSPFPTELSPQSNLTVKSISPYYPFTEKQAEQMRNQIRDTRTGFEIRFIGSHVPPLGYEVTKPNE